MNNSVQLDFLRHGQTYFNLYGKIQGWSSSLLTEEGKRATKETAQRKKVGVS